jgi:hypothetical protein
MPTVSAYQQQDKPIFGVPVSLISASPPKPTILNLLTYLKKSYLVYVSIFKYPRPWSLVKYHF